MTSPIVHCCRRSRQFGLTLIELMVALALGLFLSLGLVIMMGDQSRTFKIQDDYARMQENAVSALRYLTESLRHSGFYGFLGGDNLLLTPYGTVGSVANDCANAAIGNTLDTDRPLVGFDNVAAAPVPCVTATNFRNPSSVLVVRLATGVAVRDVLPAAVPPTPAGNGRFDDDILVEPDYAATLYVQSDANSGWVFRGTDYAGLVAEPVSHEKRFPNGAQIPVFPYQMHVYYIRPCSRPGAAGTCDAADDGGRPIPTLVRQELRVVGGALTMVEQPLAEGIERMELMYGVDATGDGIADRYTFNPGPAPADWAGVVSVRVTLLVRTPTPIPGQNDSGKCYDLNGNGVCDPATDPRDFVCPDATTCAYKRALFSQIIQVRNAAYRRGG